MTDPNAKPRIALGADHAGYHIKETIKQYLEEAGYAVDDLGTWSEEAVDYPDYGKAVGERVARGEDDLGIGVCGTGIGMAIVANKVPGIRAAVAHDEMTARLAREHNDANVLTLGGRVVNEAQAIQIVKTFLSARFAGGRHQRRVNKIAQIETEERRGSTAAPNA
ncbi:MAG: ribose 5-phosphate isomerase B [Candidatus Acidiferrales bacterium]|jgi:ribose 5-phosphate isomerase B